MDAIILPILFTENKEGHAQPETIKRQKHSKQLRFKNQSMLPHLPSKRDIQDQRPQRALEGTGPAHKLTVSLSSATDRKVDCSLTCDQTVNPQQDLQTKITLCNLFLRPLINLAHTQLAVSNQALALNFRS